MWKTVGVASNPLKKTGQPDTSTFVRCQKNTKTGQFRSKISRGKNKPRPRAETIYWNNGEKGEEWK